MLYQELFGILVKPIYDLCRNCYCFIHVRLGSVWRVLAHMCPQNYPVLKVRTMILQFHIFAYTHLSCWCHVGGHGVMHPRVTKGEDALQT